MHLYLERYKSCLKNPSFIFSILVSVALLGLSLMINYYAGTYATEKASNAVTDIILNNIPTYDVDGFFVYGSVVFWAFVMLICMLNPSKIPFTLKTVALFVLVRSVFITLTHIGPFPVEAPIDSNLIEDFTFGGDLFFSGHTGLPFLMALIFWENFRLRILFILTSVFFAAIVLMAHYHYSIDVLSAFFITYTIAQLAEKFFAADRRTFYDGL